MSMWINILLFNQIATWNLRWAHVCVCVCGGGGEFRAGILLHIPSHMSSIMVSLSYLLLVQRNSLVNMIRTHRHIHANTNLRLVLGLVIVANVETADISSIVYFTKTFIVWSVWTFKFQKIVEIMSDSVAESGSGRRRYHLVDTSATITFGLLQLSNLICDTKYLPKAENGNNIQISWQINKWKCIVFQRIHLEQLKTICILLFVRIHNSQFTIHMMMIIHIIIIIQELRKFWKWFSEINDHVSRSTWTDYIWCKKTFSFTRNIPRKYEKHGKRLSGKWNAFTHTHTYGSHNFWHPTRDLIYYILLLTLIKGNDGYKIDGFHCSIPVLRPFSNYGK